MRYTFYSILLLIGIPFFFSCKKDREEKINIEGFLLRDALGNPIGTIGNAVDDWQIRSWSEMPANEQAFLSFPDNIDMANTTVTTVYSPLAFPNPVSNLSSIQFRSDDSIKLKIVIVDADGNVLKTMADKIKGAKVFYFDVSDQAQFPSGKSLRYYYNFSSMGQANSKAGYGDIKVCRSNPYTDCFK